MPGFLAGPVTGFIERQKGKGFVTSSALQQFGKGPASSPGGGNLFVGGSQAGIGNGNDTTEDVLFTGSLPIGSFDSAGRELTIQAWGSITATSANKNARVYFGSTVLVNFAATTTQTGVWSVYASILKTGPSTQTALVWTDTTITAVLVRAVSVLSPNETDTAAIVCKVTGQVSAGGAGIVLCNGLIISGYN